MNACAPLVQHFFPSSKAFFSWCDGERLPVVGCWLNEPEGDSLNGHHRACFFLGGVIPTHSLRARKFCDTWDYTVDPAEIASLRLLCPDNSWLFGARAISQWNLRLKKSPTHGPREGNTHAHAPQPFAGQRDFG